MSIKFKVLFLCSFLPIYLFSQSNYAKKVIDTLCSAYFFGRNIEKNGELKAAKFIKQEFLNMGLDTFISKPVMQPFTFSINSFDGAFSCKTNIRALEPGVDFIINPASTSKYGSFNLVWYNSNNFPDKKHLNKLVKKRFFNEKIVVLDTSFTNKYGLELVQYNYLNAAGYITFEKKLTASRAQKRADIFHLIFKEGCINQKHRNINIEIDNKWEKFYSSHNVIAYKKGTQFPDSFYVLSAHYDHIGGLGTKVYFPGANDNASGTSMLLDLAQKINNNPLKYSVVFIAFGAEESGLVGSEYFVNHPYVDLSKIKFVINLDLTGTGDEGITVVNGSIYKKQFDQIVKINEKHHYFSKVKKRGEAANSDHYWFYKKGIPSFFIYTMGGSTAYHDVEDTTDKLTFYGYDNLEKLILELLE
ncbi:MAG: hypothetical protein Kow0079_08940 [Vicingaceae bacterium]